MPVIITAKKDGFRRGGMAHPAKPATYPDGAFTAEQLAAFQAEPMLVVHVAEAGAPEPGKDAGDKPLADMTKAELAAWLGERKVEYAPSANKAELLALAQAKAAEGNAE